MQSLDKEKIKVLLLEGIDQSSVELFHKHGYSNVEALPAALNEEELIEKLPLELEEEVRLFVEFLLEKQKKKSGPLILSWKGALKNLKEPYSSEDLQNKALEWWVSK